MWLTVVICTVEQVFVIRSVCMAERQKLWYSFSFPSVMQPFLQDLCLQYFLRLKKKKLRFFFEFLNHCNNRVVKLWKCERMTTHVGCFLPFSDKEQTKEGSSCVLANKSYFENPLLTQCRIIIASRSSIQYLGFDFFCLHCNFLWSESKIPHKIGGRFL